MIFFITIFSTTLFPQLSMLSYPWLNVYCYNLFWYNFFLNVSDRFTGYLQPYCPQYHLLTTVQPSVPFLSYDQPWVIYRLHPIINNRSLIRFIILPGRVSTKRWGPHGDWWHSMGYLEGRLSYSMGLLKTGFVGRTSRGRYSQEYI